MLFVNQSGGCVGWCAVCKSIGLKIALANTKRLPLLLNDDGDDYKQTFLGETLNMAIIDSSCINTVCGEAWLNCYSETLSDSNRSDSCTCG